MPKIYYERNKNLGNYETVKLGVEVEYDEHMRTLDEAIEVAKHFVVTTLNGEKSLNKEGTDK